MQNSYFSREKWCFHSGICSSSAWSKIDWNLSLFIISLQISLSIGKFTSHHLNQSYSWSPVQSNLVTAERKWIEQFDWIFVTFPRSHTPTIWVRLCDVGAPDESDMGLTRTYYEEADHMKKQAKNLLCTEAMEDTINKATLKERVGLNAQENLHEGREVRAKE